MLTIALTILAFTSIYFVVKIIRRSKSKPVTNQVSGAIPNKVSRDQMTEWYGVLLGRVLGNKKTVERLLEGARKKYPGKPEIILIQIEIIRLYEDNNPEDPSLTNLIIGLKEKGLTLHPDLLK